MIQPVCKLYCYGSDSQLLSAMKVLVEMDYAFVYSGKQNFLMVRTRRNVVCREIEKEFAELGVKTERHYDR